jgi:hypothetical protein
MGPFTAWASSGNNCHSKNHPTGGGVLKSAIVKVIRGVVVFALAAASASLTPSSAQAYEFLGCKYAGSGNSLKWQNVTSRYAYSNPAGHAINAWNSTSTQFNFAEVTSGANLRLADGNFGNLSMWGILRDASGVDTGPADAPKCSDGRWTETNTAWVNRYHLDSQPGWVKKSVYVHEVGHALGLAHEVNQGCVIMHPDVGTFIFECLLDTPTQDDINGANALY